MAPSVAARLGEDDDLVYLSDEFYVIASLFAGDTVFVTFQSATRTPGLHRPGFGEEFFRKRGRAAAHTVPAQSAWYQSLEMPHICDLIKKEAKPYKRIVTYGSSMGGYAAINFAHLIGATDVIAFSPQFTIDPNRAPNEKRYLDALKRMPNGFVYDQPAGLDWSKTRVTIVYDPFDPGDAYQAGLAAANIPATLVRLNYATHPITAVLSNASMKNFIMTYPSSPDDAISGIRRDYDKDKAESWLYWLTLAKRRPRSRQALAAAMKSAELNPDHTDPQVVIGNLLLAKKQYPEAIKAYNLALTKARGIPSPYIGKARAFIGMKMWERARSSVEEARKRRGDPVTITNLERIISQNLRDQSR